MPSPRPAAQRFRDLLVWRKAHDLVQGLRLHGRFPKRETYGLALQMRRAAVSIANIAEGFRRRSKPEKARYKNIRVPRGKPVLPDPGAGSWLRRHGPTRQRIGLEEVSRLLSAYAAAILTSPTSGS